MTYEEIVNRKLIEAAQELTRELDAEMRHDMIGARIYYEDREAGERWLRMEFQKHKPESITPGETVLIDNRCENPVEIAAGVVFRKDGDYIVSVRNGRITVCRNSGAFKEPTDIPPEIIEAAKENERRIKAWASEMYDDFVAEKRAEIERLKAEIARMPPIDYDKLAANPPKEQKQC